MVKIVGIMRFSVVTESHKRGYKAVRDLSLEEAIATVLDPERVARRMALVEIMPLASLSAQTDNDFALHMLISTELQPQFKERIYELEAALDYLHVIEVGVREDVQAHLRGLVVKGEPTVTFRLDDDDAVGPHHIADLRSMATPDNEGKLLSNPAGVYVMPKNGKLVMQEVSYVNNSYGIGYLSSAGKNIFSAGSHSEFRLEHTALGDRPHAWIRSIHGDSDSGSPMKRHLPIRELEPATLPDYGFVDFTALGRNLSEAKKKGWRTHIAETLVGIFKG